MNLLCLPQLFERIHSFLGEPLPQYDVGCLLIVDADLQFTAAETLDLLIEFSKRHMLIGSNELENFFCHRTHMRAPKRRPVGFRVRSTDPICQPIREKDWLCCERCRANATVFLALSSHVAPQLIRSAPSAATLVSAAPQSPQ